MYYRLKMLLGLGGPPTPKTLQLEYKRQLGVFEKTEAYQQYLDRIMDSDDMSPRFIHIMKRK